jgi:hypothetical protein
MRRRGQADGAGSQHRYRQSFEAAHSTSAHRHIPSRRTVTKTSIFIVCERHRTTHRTGALGRLVPGVKPEPFQLLVSMFV